MDEPKEYDCIPHDLLIAKPEAYSLDRTILRLLMDHLNSHKQWAKVGSFYRNWYELKYGIPQGSILDSYYSIYS